MHAKPIWKIVIVILCHVFLPKLEASTDPGILMLEQVNARLINLFKCDTESQRFSGPFCQVVCEKIEKSGDPLRSILEIDFLINQMTARLSGSCGDESMPMIDVELYTRALILLLNQIQNLSLHENHNEAYRTNAEAIKRVTLEWCHYMQHSAHPFHFFQLIAEYVKASGLIRNY